MSGPERDLLNEGWGPEDAHEPFAGFADCTSPDICEAPEMCASARSCAHQALREQASPEGRQRAGWLRSLPAWSELRERLEERDYWFGWAAAKPIDRYRADADVANAAVHLFNAVNTAGPCQDNHTPDDAQWWRDRCFTIWHGDDPENASNAASELAEAAVGNWPPEVSR